MTLDYTNLRTITDATSQPGPWHVVEKDGHFIVLDRDGMAVCDVGRDPLQSAHIAAWSPDVADAALKEIERLLAEDEEWSKLCNAQNAILEAKPAWPPERNKCGWCTHAAGDTIEAAESVPTMSLEEVREHTKTCANNPANAEIERLRKLLGEACSELEDTAGEWALSEAARIRKEAGIE